MRRKQKNKLIILNDLVQCISIEREEMQIFKQIYSQCGITCMVILENKACMYASICFKSYTIFIYRMKCWDFFIYFFLDFFFVSFLLEHVSVQCNNYFIFKKKNFLSHNHPLCLSP